MIKKRDYKHMGRTKDEWLQSWHHFAFADYFHPNFIHFGNLRVLNDDMMASHTGFPYEYIENMEVITYVIQGSLEHEDSLHHKRILYRGEVQYMSCGSGMYHSERNSGEDSLRCIQLWILPNQQNLEPNYIDLKLAWDKRENTLYPIASNELGKTGIHLQQDMNIYASSLHKDIQKTLRIEKNRQVYIVVLEGELQVNEVILQERDALIASEESLCLQAKPYAHFLLLEMQQI